MNKNKLFTKKRLETLLSKNDNSSVRVSLKISEKTLENIKNFSSTEPNFKSFFNKVLTLTIKIQDFSSKNITIGSFAFATASVDEKMKQKTFVISKTANMILDDFSSFFGLPKNKIFNLVINGYWVSVMIDIYQEAKKNKLVYQKVDKIMDQLSDNFYKSFKTITKLFSEEHTPPLEIYQNPDFPGNSHIENFLGHLSYAEVYLSNSFTPLKEAIDDCEKRISTCDYNRINKIIDESVTKEERS